MKVLLVIDSLGGGGSERSLAELLPHLAAAGVRPVIACFHDREGARRSVADRGFEVRRLEGGPVAQVLRLRRLLRELRPDLVHTTLFHASQVGRLASVASDTPVLTSLVSTPYTARRLADPNVSRRKLRIVQGLDGWTARHLTDHFHAVSQAVKEAATSTLGIRPERVTVIERGRDPRRLGSPGPDRRAAARERLGLLPEAPVVITVGRQEYVKGQGTLIRAAAHLRKHHPALRVLLVGGPGHSSKEIEALVASAGLGDAVRLLGFRDDVPEILAAADVFALPSLWEGFPGAALEAMALGLPVVGSDLSSLREMVGPGAHGLLAEPESPEALARVLDRVLSDPEFAAESGRGNRERFFERFTIARSAERMLELYRRVIERKGERP